MGGLCDFWDDEDGNFENSVAISINVYPTAVPTDQPVPPMNDILSSMYV